MEEIIKLAREMGKALQSTELYEDLNDARSACDDDEALQQQIDEFDRLGQEMNEKAAENEDEKAVEELNEKMMELYGKIMSNKKMTRFYAAKETIDIAMNKAMDILTAALNGADPMTYVPAEPHVHDHGCDGDCCGCSGCN